MSQEIKNGELYIVTIQNKKEREILYKYCLKNNINILYPDLFTSKKVYPIWGITSDGVALSSTTIARNTPSDHILKINDLL